MVLSRSRTRAAVALAALLACAALPRRASASDFSEDGTFRFDPEATFVLDFEEDIVPEGATESVTVPDPGALSGARVLGLEPFGGIDLPIEVAPGANAYRVSAWTKGGETIADVEVRYADNLHEGVDELAVLYPTGRMTSDGWIEFANDDIRVDTGRGATITIGFFSPGGSIVDAVEVVHQRALGPTELSGRACAGSSDPVCGEAQTCLFSQCRYVGGWVPPIPQGRDEVAAYLAGRMQLLFGPLLNRELDLPLARVALDRMQTASDKWTYWNAFMLGVRRLHDGHTTTNGVADFVLESEKPLAICFIEGDADLSTAIAPKDPLYLDVLVSHVGPYRNLGLKPGDRLVAVDGEHPIAWARAQTEHHWPMSPTSNHRTYAELAEQLRGLVARYAHTLTVISCEPSTSVCSAPFEIDVSAVPHIQPGETYEGVACDNRPLRHLANSPRNHASEAFDSVYFGVVKESDDVERIYGAEWESLYTTTGNDYVGANLKAAIAEFQANANGVILDHRSGNGGTILAPQIIWNWATPPHNVTVYLDRQRAEDEALGVPEGLALFQKGVLAGYADSGGSAAPTTMPVALLVTRDVSASDWLPLGLKGAAPNVRIFGPFETNGAFSTRYAFGYWLGLNYVMAVGESFDASGLSRGGRGAEPDVVVLPKQSDLLAGKDTVFEAALAWVRQEMTP